MLDLEAIINRAHTDKASDIHITPALPVFLRVNGTIKPVGQVISGDDINATLNGILSAHQLDKMHKNRQLDFIYHSNSGLRLRGNAFRCRSGYAMCLRLVLPELIPLSELGFSDLVNQQLLSLKKGLILIVGPTGQGKSTTIASILTERSRLRAEHIITIEDPIENLIQSDRSIIQQRELGRDVKDFKSGMMGALREDPDIVMVGEMRNTEVMEATLTMAETGHLVMTTLHTVDAEQTLSRLIDSFHPVQQPQITSQLIQNLQIIIAQKLIPAIDGTRSVLAHEILVMNYAIANHIRDRKSHLITNAMQSDPTGYMVTFERSLANLIVNKRISIEVGLDHADDREQLQSLLKNQGITIQ